MTGKGGDADLPRPASGDARKTTGEELPATGGVRVVPLEGIPLVRPGDDITALVLEAVARAGTRLADGDVLVLAQKMVSKAEGRLVDLRAVEPSPRAARLARQVAQDPRLVEVILSESRAVVRAEPGVLITETNLGFVCANAGVDRSNVASDDEVVALLPVDPDGSAAALRASFGSATGADVGVVISDSHGRPWREGVTGVALGSAGVEPILDLRGRADLFGRELRATIVGNLDEIAAAASLCMGQADEAVPAVLLRGIARREAGGRGAGELQRDVRRDLFR